MAAKIILADGAVATAFLWWFPVITSQPGLWPALIVSLFVWLFLGIAVGPLVGRALRDMRRAYDREVAERDFDL